jgi:hypothetical protein
MLEKTNLKTLFTQKKPAAQKKSVVLDAQIRGEKMSKKILVLMI